MSASNAEPGQSLTTPSFARDSKGQHLVRAAVIGVVAGLVAVAFKWVLTESERTRGALLEWLHARPHASLWGWAVLPLLGLSLGCLIGWMVKRFAPDAPGSGIPHLKGVLLHVKAMGWKGLLPVKFLGGVLGIGSGLSLGREGPTVQMGAAVGQALAEFLRVPSRSVPQLVSCGAGAGIAAAFNAPLAGFLFVIEELHRELSARTFAGALVAALSADIMARALGGELPSFSISGYASIPLSALPVAVLIGLVGGVLGVCFNRSLLLASRASSRLSRVPRWMLPGIAAGLCGLVAWWFPDVVGGGHIAADKLLGGHLAAGLGLLVLMLIAKFLLTVISYGSGAPGGIFAPMLLLGALSGSIIADLLSRPFASLQHMGTALAILGMAAFFSGSVRAPLTGIVLIIEMTGNYQQLLALGVACLTADLTAGSLRDTPIYEALLELDLRNCAATKGTEQALAAPRSIYIGIQRGSEFAGTSIRTCGMPGGCLVVSVERSGRELLPEADLVLLAGDHLTVLVPDGEAPKAMKIVRMATGI